MKACEQWNSIYGYRLLRVSVQRQTACINIITLKPVLREGQKVGW